MEKNRFKKRQLQKAVIFVIATNNVCGVQKQVIIL